MMYLLSLLPFLATGLATPLPLPDVVQACTTEQLQQGTCNAAPARKPILACRNNIDNSNIPSPGLDLGSLPHRVSSVLVPKADFSAALQIPKIVFSNPQETTVATADATQGTLAPSVGIGNYNDPAGNLPFPTGTVSAAGYDKRSDTTLDDGMSDYGENTIDHLLVLLERDEQWKRYPSIDDGEQEPIAHFIETSHTGLESRSSLDLVPRMASSRHIFVGNINYRQIARQQGIIMIEADGPNPGERICIITPQQVNNPLIDEDSIAYAWVGEHKFEIYFVEMFFKNKNAAIPQTYASQFGSIWQALTQCGPALSRMQDILNSGLNLIGVSADINQLKKMLLQHGGVADWHNKPSWNSVILIARTHEYLKIIQNDYNTVAFLIAKTINSVGTQNYGDPSTTPSPGQDFIIYAQRIYSVALDMTAEITTPLDVAGEYDVHALPSP